MSKPSIIRLHRHALSGHCHRVEVFLSILGLPFECVDIDLAAGAHKTPAFLALNPFGQVPVIEDGDVVLADSNAMLVYLAAIYDPDGAWMPRDPMGLAATQQWLSAAAGPLAYGPAAARLNTVFGANFNVAEVTSRAHGLFLVMEATLKEKPFLIGDAPTIADLAHYAYTAHAPEGGIDLTEYPAIRAWLDRVAALKGFVPMQATPVGFAA